MHTLCWILWLSACAGSWQFHLPTPPPSVVPEGPLNHVGWIFLYWVAVAKGKLMHLYLYKLDHRIKSFPPLVLN